MKAIDKTHGYKSILSCVNSSTNILKGEFQEKKRNKKARNWIIELHLRFSKPSHGLESCHPPHKISAVPWPTHWRLRQHCSYITARIRFH